MMAVTGTVPGTNPLLPLHKLMAYCDRMEQRWVWGVSGALSS